MTRRGRTRLRASAQRALDRLTTALLTERPASHDELDRKLAPLDDDERAPILAQRDALLAASARSQDALIAHTRATNAAGVRMVTTTKGARIARVATETFPGHVNYVYALEIDGTRVLFDVGTGIGRSRSDILGGLDALAVMHGARFSPSTFDVVLVSHGHIDHFGDVAFFRGQGAALYTHRLDARVLENFPERMALSGRAMRGWLDVAGIAPAVVDELVAMYLAEKHTYSAPGLEVDVRLRHNQRLFHERARVIHTPGHCPGHVCLLVDDEALLVADQVLAPITPHISPQALHPHNGIDRYIAGLARLRTLSVKHVLPSHYDDIPDLGAAIDHIASHHAEQSQRVLDVCRAPSSIHDVARALFGEQEGYGVLLALLEAGSHVEYLHQVGALAVANLDELDDPRVAPRYARLDGAAAAEPLPGPALA